MIFPSENFIITHLLRRSRCQSIRLTRHTLIPPLLTYQLLALYPSIRVFMLYSCLSLFLRSDILSFTKTFFLLHIQKIYILLSQLLYSCVRLCSQFDIRRADYTCLDEDYEDDRIDIRDGLRNLESTQHVTLVTLLFQDVNLCLVLDVRCCTFLLLKLF